MLPTLEYYARELKTFHEAWMEMLSQVMPDIAPAQISSEALEMALTDLEDRLSAGSHQDGSEPLSLDAAMAFIRHHTLPV